jgi:hypothetical protein
MTFHILEMIIRRNDYLCNCTLPDDGPVRLETCRVLCQLKQCCDYNEACAVYYIVTIKPLMLQGNYVKFLKHLHSEQVAKLQAKNQHECDLLEDIR